MFDNKINETSCLKLELLSAKKLIAEQALTIEVASVFAEYGMDAEKWYIDTAARRFVPKEVSNVIPESNVQKHDQ